MNSNSSNQSQQQQQPRNYAETAERLAALLEDEGTPKSIRSDIEDSTDLLFQRLCARIRPSHPEVMRRVLPLLMELDAERPELFHRLDE